MVIEKQLRHRRVRVNSGHRGVLLPNGVRYDGPTEVLLTDSEYARLSERAFSSGVLTDLGEADELTPAAHDALDHAAVPGVLSDTEHSTIDHAGLPGIGRVLARVEYNPAADTTVTTTSGALVDVDATNAAVTFTAPSSGEVDVVLSAMVQHNNATYVAQWGLREGAAAVSGKWGVTRAANNSVRVTLRIRVTGLAAGSSHTYKFAHAISTDAAATTSTSYGGIFGPLTMEVLAA